MSAETEALPRAQGDRSASATIVGQVLLGAGMVLGEGESLEDQQLEWSAPALRRVVQEGESTRVTYDGARAFELLAADGSFRLRELPCGAELELLLETPFGDLRTSVAPLAPGERRRVELVLGRDGDWRRVQGVARDEFGELAEGVEIWLKALDRSGVSTVQRTTTGPAGRFVLSRVPKGEYGLRTWGHSYALGAELEIDLRAGDVSGLDLRVTRGLVLVGEVLWPDDVPVMKGEASFGGKYASIEYGSLQVPGLSSEPGMLRIEAQRPGSVGRLEQTMTPGSGLERWVLTELRTFEVTVEVVDSRSLEMIHASVDGVILSEGTTHTRARVTRSRQRGAFVAEFPAGPARLYVRADNHPQREIELVVDGPQRVRVELEAAALLRGIVLDNQGEPCKDATIHAGESSVQSSADGSFELFSSSNPQGLQAWKSGFAPSAELVIDPHDPSSTTSIVLRLRPGCVLEGHAIDLDPRMGVTLAQDGKWLESRGFELDGSFRFTDQIVGTYDVYVEAEDGRLGPSVRVELVPGAPVHVELRGPGRARG